MVVGLEREDGSYLSLPQESEEIRLADEIFLYGPDASLSELARREIPLRRS